MSTDMPEPIHFIGFTEVISVWEGCRCAQLREVFGDGAPVQCGPCRFRARRLELIARAWVDVPAGHRQAYVDCGVDLATLEDSSVWVPCWANRIVAQLYGSHACGPVLTRAAVDAEFREAVAAFIDLNPSPATERRGEAYERLLEFARSAGVPITTSTA